MALVNRIFSLTQSDLPAPQGTTRQAGDCLENPQKQAKVKEYERQNGTSEVVILSKQWLLTKEESQIELTQLIVDRK